jgi:hypothetical protein
MAKAAIKARRTKPIRQPRTNQKAPAISEELKREAMRAYCEWLFMEHRLLCKELEPDYKPSGRWSPVNSAASDFHIPSFDRYLGWEKSPPSSRAIPMMQALGVDVEKHLKPENLAPQAKFNRERVKKNAA